MIEKAKYINHMNESVEFGTGGMFINLSDIRDYSWEVVSKNNKISNFRKGVQTRKLPVVIVCASEDEGLKKKNLLYETIEKDIIARQCGKLVIGDYYMRCYITASAKSEYLTKKSMLKLNLTVNTDYPYWIKEEMHTYTLTDLMSEGTDMDYESDFDYDYSSNVRGTNIINSNFIPSNFRMRIYGAVTNPTVDIAGHAYTVNVSLSEGEYLTIDSIEKTIVKIQEDLSEVNCFNLRDKDSYIFEQIPSGSSTLNTNYEFRFDITLLEERGEPKWT